MGLPAIPVAGATLLHGEAGSGTVAMRILGVKSQSQSFESIGPVLISEQFANVVIPPLTKNLHMTFERVLTKGK